MEATQIFGLKESALRFLEENVERIPNVVCPKCKEVITHIENKKVYENARSAGMHCDGPRLYEYILKDGRVIREVINKYRPRTSSLCLFIDLMDSDGNLMYEWSKEEIDLKIES